MFHVKSTRTLQKQESMASNACKLHPAIFFFFLELKAQEMQDVMLSPNLL